MQPELKVRKILGRTYLNENRLAEALDIFIKILIDYPDDLETLLILGGFYLASGDGKTAKSLYLRAQELDPQNQTIERQIVMADEIVGNGAAEPVPTDMEAVARLLQRLTGQTKVIDENDIVRAANLLAQITSSENPAELVANHLDEIDELLLALIELNIRQAQADGRPDVAEALHGLQLNIGYQRSTREENGAVESQNSPSRQPAFSGRVLMLLPDLERKSNRMKLLRSVLDSCGCQVIEQDEYVSTRYRKPDVVITSNPHTNPTLLESLSVLSKARVPIILDLDTDVENQPVSHHDYSAKGLSTQTRGNAYTAALDLANIISVPSQRQAVSLRAVAEHVLLIPDGWSRQNTLWEKSPAPHNTINIGWAGSGGQLEDLMLVRRFIVRIIREFPNTRIVIIGNLQAYRLFDGLPENRRMYLPLVADEEFPYLLSQLDVLLAPLRNLPYNQSLPDTPLVEAGAKGIPWIASPIPAFRSWNAGGIISESPDEWHLNMRHLVVDADLRRKLGLAGKEAAKTREMSQLAGLWLELISQAMTIDSSLRTEAEEIRARV
jgi:glycosyltransferase involved in cell wall biosynthesis